MWILTCWAAVLFSYRRTLHSHVHTHPVSTRSHGDPTITFYYECNWLCDLIFRISCIQDHLMIMMIRNTNKFEIPYNIMSRPLPSHFLYIGNFCFYCGMFAYSYRWENEKQLRSPSLLFFKESRARENPVYPKCHNTNLFFQNFLIFSLSPLLICKQTP